MRQAENINVSALSVVSVSLYVQLPVSVPVSVPVPIPFACYSPIIRGASALRVTLTVVCAVSVSRRTFRRYLAVSRTMTDSKFYIPMTPKEKAKLSKRLSKRALSEQSKSGNNRSNDGDDGDNGNDSGSSSGNGHDNGNGNTNGSGSSRSSGPSKIKGEKSGKSESKQLGRPAKKRVKLATKHKRAKSLDPRIVDASNMYAACAPFACCCCTIVADPCCERPRVRCLQVRQLCNWRCNRKISRPVVSATQELSRCRAVVQLAEAYECAEHSQLVAVSVVEVLAAGRRRS